MAATLDLNYKRSDEYKAWTAAIKADFPTLPDYLIDLAIYSHKTNPKAWRQAPKGCKPAQPGKPQHTVLDDAVKVYSADELPEVPLVRLVEA